MSVTSAGGTRRAGSKGSEADFAGAPSTLVHELTRLRNELKVKDGAIEERSVEVATLQRQLRAAEEGIQGAERELEAAKERLLAAEGDAQSLKKQVAALQAERNALLRENETSERGTLRLMDREIEALSHKAAAADTAQIRVKDLESAVAALRSDLAAARGEAATLARQQAAAAAEAAEARREADRAARELGSTSDYLEGVMAELAKAQGTLQSTRRESKLLEDKLHAATRPAAATAVAPGSPRSGAGAAGAPPRATSPRGPAALAGDDTAIATMHAALQQALQQLSLRTDEVQGLRKELEAAQAAAAGGGAAAAAADAGSLSAPLTPEVPAATEAVPAPASTVAASSAQGSGPASPASAAVGEAAGSDGGHAAGSPRAGGDAAAAGAAARHEPSALLYELQDARHQIKHLKGQVAQLRQHLADAAAGSDDNEESDDDVAAALHRTPRRSMSATRGGGAPYAAAALSPAEQAAEERRRNSQRGHAGSIWFGSDGGHRAERVAAAGGLTKEALAEVIDRLIDSREQQARRRSGKAVGRGAAARGVAYSGAAAALGGHAGDVEGGGGGGGGRDDTALWEEATAMLRGELIRLGQEAARKMEENERLRSEVGELKSARLSAEATAARLEELNGMSIRVASLKIELAALRSEQDIREEELLGQVAALQAALAKKKRRKSPGKMLKKAAEAIRHGLSSPVQAQEAPASPAQQQQQQQQQGAAAAPNGGELRRTWGSIKSKFSMSGRGSSKEEEAYAAAAGPASPTATAAAADSPRR
ncbi:hypothetical protein C2E20_3926 [Micractinium conductrix]|uniref:Uncharacterized protein n=1 Tax=Micractinium conductrix TaxID=554055 RepID=A0A2P6VFL7_9CHLO|nr:hypothetical protein C2E20_3926 [Micractinium conductrix]|eukprot:PSC72868.1 hypothetical protein C2E20_3926 [Micractinium conductrix]